MSDSSVKVDSSKVPSSSEEGEKKLRPCCACPETRKLRDECIIEKGEVDCTDLIEAHKTCLRSHGFKV